MTKRMNLTLKNTLRTAINSVLREMMWWMRYAMSEKLLSNFWSQCPEVEQLNRKPVHRELWCRKNLHKAPFYFWKKETNKILVSEREKLADGTVRQEIKIYYKFIGFVGELHITPTKRWTALKPKNCTVCGVEYVPSSGISKYCPACAKRIQREKSNESKRRSRERNRRACIELSAKNDRLIWSISVLWLRCPHFTKIWLHTKISKSELHCSAWTMHELTRYCNCPAHEYRQETGRAVFSWYEAAAWYCYCIAE